MAYLALSKGLIGGLSPLDRGKEGAFLVLFTSFAALLCFALGRLELFTVFMVVVIPKTLGKNLAKLLVKNLGA